MIENLKMKKILKFRYHRNKKKKRQIKNINHMITKENKAFKLSKIIRKKIK